jgi:ATP-dependent Clp protease ATP-binding subunit ClpA
MDDNFSPRVKDVIAYSKEEALRLGHDFIGTEHLMLGLLRDGNGKAISILDAMDVDLDHLRRKVEILSPPNPNATTQPKDKKNLHLTRQAERALKTTFLEAKLFQSSSINTAHLLLCILRNENDPTTAPPRKAVRNRRLRSWTILGGTLHAWQKRTNSILWWAGKRRSNAYPRSSAGAKRTIPF